MRATRASRSSDAGPPTARARASGMRRVWSGRMHDADDKMTSNTSPAR